MKKYGFGVFFTLTYDEQSVPTSVDPESGELLRTVRKSDVQAHLKRFRMNLKRERGLSDWSYFITSEYGPRTLRPHYHGIFFGVKLDDFLIYFANPWQKRFGFTSQSQITLTDADKATSYVAKYCSKGSFENPLVKAGKVEKTFHLISKGLGINYLTDETCNYHLCRDMASSRRGSSEQRNSFLDEVLRRSRVSVSKGFVSLPRYYKARLFQDRPSLSLALQDRVLSRSLLLRDQKFGLVLPDGSPNHQAFKDMADQENCEAFQRESTFNSLLAKHFDKSKI